MRGTIVAALLALGLLGLASAAHADVVITDQTYVRHDGGMDPTIIDCNNPATTPAAGGDGSSNRQQNEPTAAIDPLNAQHMTAGANDYCPVQTTTDAWAGFYYSADSGGSWTNSLLPGYPTDTSTAGQQSPLFNFVVAAGDPVQDWDREKHVYYAGIAFNRQQPQNGSIWLARYLWPDVQTTPTYEFTTLVSRGTPGVSGIFEDKVELGVDIGTASPHQGNVYVCWARFTGAGNNAIELATSTDGGRTFRIQRISEGVHGNQSCDVAVTRTGKVFVTWRQFEFTPGAPVPQKQRDAVMWVRSDDGGRRFTKPAEAFQFVHWDMTDRTLGGGGARDCGDGPLACQSGYVFGRVDSGPRNGADPVAGEGDEAYVVIEATVEGTETPTGTTYGTVASGTGSQGAVFFSKTENGGADWSDPVQIDPQAKGHQFYPDIDVDDGNIVAVYHDSRADNAAGPPGTVGDFRTVPFGNVWTAAGTAESTAGIGLETWYSTSNNGGATWTSDKASDVTYLQNYEQFGNRDVPFFGDYNYVDVVGSTVLMNWTDSRDTVGGTDPRYDEPTVAPDDGTDGFDVVQCRVFAMNAWSADNCPNQGGLNQNIYGLVLP